MKQLPDRLHCVECNSIHELTCPDGVRHHAGQRKGRRSCKRWYESIPCPDCGGELKFAGLSEARRELAAGCLRLAYKEAIMMVQRRRKLHKVSPLFEDEAVSDALIGLTRAAELFDPTSGFQFTTYAVRCIRSVLYGPDSLARSSVSTKDTSIAYGGGDERWRTDFFDRLIDQCSPEIDSRVIANENTLLVSKVMKVFSSRHRAVIEARFMDDQTLSEISNTLGVSKERVRQDQVEAIRIAREVLGVDDVISPELVNRVLDFIRRWPGCTRTALAMYLNWDNSPRISRLIRHLIESGDLRTKSSRHGARLWIAGAR